MTISQIRHVLGEKVATKILRLIKLGRSQNRNLCPFCEKPMMVVNTQTPPLELEACRACSAVWFDLPTYESLPELTTETTNSIPMQVTEIIAMNRLRELKEREEEERLQAEKKKRLHRFSDLSKEGEQNR